MASINRIPPQNIEAEQAVLGAMLLDNNAIADATETLRADDFYLEAHRLIFEAIVALSDRNSVADLLTVSEQLKKSDSLEKAGGDAYIASLANFVMTSANIRYHAHIVLEKSQLRNLINTSTKIVSEAYEDADEIEDLLGSAEKRILEVTGRGKSFEFKPVDKLVADVFERAEQRAKQSGALTGLASGFRDLDKLTSGFQPSDLILVAARPSMGKTAFTLNIASYVATRLQKPVAFFSLEMSNVQLVQRILCSEGSINSQALRDGEMQSDEWEKLASVSDRVSKAPIYIDDTPGITVAELRSKARRIKSEHGLSLVVIDYLQLMQGRVGRNNDSRQQEISDISRSLKALARELDVPVIALSQLSRSVEARQNKRPMLSDLRESGSLEQDADIVMFLYREDYYKEDSDRKNVTDVIVAKHRNGPLDTIQLYFAKEYTKFTSLEKGA